MNDAPVVGGSQPSRYLDGIVNGLAHGQGSRLEALAQAFSLQ